MVVDLIHVDDDLYNQFLALDKRVNKTKPAKEDVRALEIFLEDNPIIIRDTEYLGNRVIDDFIDTLYVKAAVRVKLRATMEDMKLQFGYTQSSIIERMLFDTILMSWLRLNYLEGCYNETFRKNMFSKEAEFYDKRVSAAQRRFTRAIDTLGRLKKFNVNFQVNIAAEGSQQINILKNDQSSPDRP